MFFVQDPRFQLMSVRLSSFPPTCTERWSSRLVFELPFTFPEGCRGQANVALK